jgi:hypothetical protein
MWRNIVQTDIFKTGLWDTDSVEKPPTFRSVKCPLTFSVQCVSHKSYRYAPSEVGRLFRSVTEVSRAEGERSVLFKDAVNC